MRCLSVLVSESACGTQWLPSVRNTVEHSEEVDHDDRYDKMDAVKLWARYTPVWLAKGHSNRNDQFTLIVHVW